MATSARRTALKRQKKSDSENAVLTSACQERLPPEVAEVTQIGPDIYKVRFTPNPYRDLAERVSFQQLFDEALGRQPINAPRNYFLCSFLKSEILASCKGLFPRDTKMSDRDGEIIQAFYRHTDIELASEIVAAKSKSFRKAVDICGKMLKVDDAGYQIQHEVSAEEHFGYDFYLLKVPKSKFGKITKRELAELASSVAKPAELSAKEYSAYPKTPLTTVLFRALVCLASKENKHVQMKQLVSLPRFQGYNPELTETARDELSKFEERIIRDISVRIRESVSRG